MKDNKNVLENMVPAGSKKLFGLNSKATTKVKKIFEEDGQPPLEDNPRFDDDENVDDLINESMDCMEELYAIIGQLEGIKDRWTPDHFEEILRHVEDDMGTSGDVGFEEEIMIFVLKKILGKE